LHAETALGTGRMTSTFECSKKWGDYLIIYFFVATVEIQKTRFLRQYDRSFDISGRTPTKNVFSLTAK
ncbi:hypothetical protein Q7I30_06375, partial [Aeromonas veronii]|uniref:hypothetical protein n=1 Tax=Aeromonas veronii TaxID=654 RepID=UPI003004C423